MRTTGRRSRRGFAEAAEAKPEKRQSSCDFEAPGDELARPHGNCYWLLPGRLLAGEHPGVGADLAGSIDALLDAGVHHVIDLTSDGENLPLYEALLRQQAARRDAQVTRERFPIADYSVPSRATMRRILDSIGLALENGSVVYLHCHGGAGRTGTVAGCLLVEHGYDAGAALRLIAGKWQAMDKRDRTPASPETPEQKQYVERWRPRSG